MTLEDDQAHVEEQNVSVMVVSVIIECSMRCTTMAHTRLLITARIKSVFCCGLSTAIALTCCTNSGWSTPEQDEAARQIQALDQSIKNDPNNAKLYYGRGLAHGTLGQYKQAVEDFSKASVLNPKSPNTYFLLGDAYDNLGQYQYAIDCYNRTIALDPMYEEVYDCRGMAYAGLKQYQKAVDDFTKELSHHQSPAVFYNRAIAHDHLKQYQKAVNDYTSAIKLRPAYGLAYYFRASAYQSMGKTALARKDRQRASALGCK